MEENKNKSNTLLLTVIAVATLLVAVIGATFAYFTAAIANAESSSTVIVNSANLSIVFADGTSTLLTSETVEPTKQENSTYAPLIVKKFNVQGTNTTGTGNTASPAMKMPYELYLVVSENTFVLQNTVSGTSISYRLVNDDETGSGANVTRPEGSIPSTTDGKYAMVPCKTLPDQNMTLPQDSDSLQTSALGAIDTYTSNGDKVLDSTTAAPNTPKGLKLGQGYFPGGSTSATTHHYTLYMYFVEDNNNQDIDKNKTFTGYVAISAGDAGTQITDSASYTAQNTGSEFPSA